MGDSTDADEPERALNRRRLAWLVGIIIALAAGGALARSALTGSGDAKSAESAAAAKEADAGTKARRYRVKVAGSSVDKGGASIQVSAPSDVVTEVLQDYGSYASFIPQFRKSEVVKRDGKFTDVRIEVPVLGGMTTFWALVRFGPPAPLATQGADAKTAPAQAIHGQFIKGNLKSLDVAWLIHPTSDSEARLHLEIHMVPNFPVPGNVVSSELESAADTGVTATRDRAEKLAREREGG